MKKTIIKTQGEKHAEIGITVRPAYYIPDPNIEFDTTLDTSEDDVLTDQSGLKASDINVIMKQYTAQGLNPHLDPSQWRYEDVSNVPPLETMFNIVKNASEAFLSLPADIRKLMDNDPSKLENFIADPNNGDTLLKYGLISVPKEPEAVTPAKVSAAKAAEIKE